MPKYKVSLPFTERIIDADDADEACDLFRNDETIFYELDTEPAEQAEPTGGAPVIDPVLIELGRELGRNLVKSLGGDPTVYDKAPRKAPQTP
jgi:hypothetical protein